MAFTGLSVTSDLMAAVNVAVTALLNSVDKGHCMERIIEFMEWSAYHDTMVFFFLLCNFHYFTVCFKLQSIYMHHAFYIGPLVVEELSF